MTRKASLIALCSAVAFGGGDDGVPDWVHLLPAGEARTVDGRGPYKVPSLQAVADASLKPGQKLVIDECHSTDLAAKLGMSAPARGWIVELQCRDDGLWGRVEWTGEGRRLMEDKAYCGLSPAVLHTADNTVVGVLRASLTNNPNLQGLVSLHSEENGMDWKARLIELLGLDSGADDAAIEAALTAKVNGSGVALCAADILEAPQFLALQSQLADITGKYNGLVEDRTRAVSTAYVDAAIAEGRVGLKPVRDEYIALHMQDGAKAEKLIGAMPKIAGAVITGDGRAPEGGSGFGAEDRLVMNLFGVDEDEYRKKLADAGVHKGNL